MKIALYLKCIVCELNNILMIMYCRYYIEFVHRFCILDISFYNSTTYFDCRREISRNRVIFKMLFQLWRGNILQVSKRGLMRYIFDGDVHPRPPLRDVSVTNGLESCSPSLRLATVIRGKSVA